MNSKLMRNRILEAQEAQSDDKQFYWLKCLSVELTRRCNMRCKFCSRGDAQNLDMPNNIIDKMLDEIQFFDLNMLRINGGEPFLAKEGMIYLINEIIRRGIKLCDVGIFTNGTVRDDDIKNALVKLGNYCKKISETPWGQKMKKITKEIELEPMYDVDSYVSVVVSTSLHDNADFIDETIDFYNKNVDPKILHTVNQDKSFLGYRDTVKINESPFETQIILRGNAIKNFQELYNEGYRKFSLHENDFTLIDDSTVYDNYILFHKAISISANGKVFAGCLQPYSEVDKCIDIICDNILNCNGNLCDYIVDFSWQHPLNESQSIILDNCKTVLLYYKNGIKDCWLYNSPLDDGIIKAAVTNIAAIEEFERGLKDLHELFPTTTHSELNIIGAVKYGFEQKDMNIREYVLKDICGLTFGENGVLPDFSDETLSRLLDNFDKVYYSRQNELFGSSLPSKALIKHATQNATQNLIKNISKIPRDKIKNMSFSDIIIAGLGLK